MTSATMQRAPQDTPAADASDDDRGDHTTTDEELDSADENFHMTDDPAPADRTVFWELSHLHNRKHATHIASIQLALDGGLDVNATQGFIHGLFDTAPRSMLFIACSNNLIEVARFLVSMGASVSKHPSVNSTAPETIFWELTHLSNRKQAAHVESITRALNAGLKVNAMRSVSGRSGCDLEMRSMLHIACKRKLVTVARFLVSMGADVNLCTPLTKKTPLFVGIESSDDEVPRIEMRKVLSIVAMLFHKGANFRHVAANGDTILHRWAFDNVFDSNTAEEERSMFSQLVRAGADRAAVNAVGNTALMAAAGTSATRMIAIMQCAAHVGDPVRNAELDAQNARGNTCLHLLICNVVSTPVLAHRGPSKYSHSQKREVLIEDLINAGVSLHIRNCDGDSADTMLSDPILLEQQGIDIDNYPVLETVNVELHKLIPNGNMQDITDAASKVTDINAHNHRYPAALFMAVSYRRVDVVSHLLTIGADALRMPLTRVVEHDPHDILVWALRRGQSEDRSIWTYMTPEPPADLFATANWKSSADIQIMLIKSVFDVRVSDRAPERKPGWNEWQGRLEVPKPSRFRSTLQLYIFEAMSAVCHAHVLLLLLQIAGREQRGGYDTRDEDGLGAVQRTVLNFSHCEYEPRMMQRAELLLSVCADESMLWERSDRHECSGRDCECCHGMCADFRQTASVLRKWEGGAFTFLGLLLYRTLPVVFTSLWDCDEEVPPHVDFLRDVVVPHAWHVMMRSRVLACLMGAHPRLGNRDCKFRLLDDSVLYSILDMFENGFSAVETRRMLTTTDSLVGV